MMFFYYLEPFPQYNPYLNSKHNRNAKVAVTLKSNLRNKLGCDATSG